MTVKVILRSDQPNAKGERSILIRVTENRKARYVSIGRMVKESQFRDEYKNWVFKHPQAVRINNEIEQALQSLQLPPKDTLTLFQAVENKIEFYRARKQPSACARQKTKLSNLKLSGLGDVPLHLLTKEYVDEYVSWRITKGCKVSGIKKELSDLSSAINGMGTDYFSLAQKSLKPQPVDRVKLTKEEINRIENLNLTGQISEARDLFLFCYYCHGMRVGSAVTFESSMIKGSVIRYRMGKGEKLREITLHPKLKAIVDRYNNKPYLFTFIKTKITDEWDKRNKVSAATAIINRHLKVIAGLAEIDKNLTTHINRHSFAYLSLEGDVSMEVIKDALGHSNFNTTQAYLKSLSDKKINDQVNKLYD